MEPSDQNDWPQSDMTISHWHNPSTSTNGVAHSSSDNSPDDDNNHGNQAAEEVSGWPLSNNPAPVWPSTAAGDSWAPARSVEGTQESLRMEEGSHEEGAVGGSDIFTAQISPDEYQKQAKVYTKTAVNQLMQSPEYQRVHTRCRMCWSIWSEGMTGTDCVECGGFSLERPCPICQGRCHQIWTRDVELSHSNNEAFWSGECGLPQEDQDLYKVQLLMEPAGAQEQEEDQMLDGMQQLSTS